MQCQILRWDKKHFVDELRKYNIIMSMISPQISAYMVGNYHRARKNMKYIFSEWNIFSLLLWRCLFADSSIVSICEMNISCQVCNDLGQVRLSQCTSLILVHLPSSEPLNPWSPHGLAHMWLHPTYLS